MRNRILKVLKVMITRGGGAFLALLSSMAVIRFMGEEYGGEYFRLIAYSLFLVTIFTYGGNQSILKNTKQNEKSINVIYHHVASTSKITFFTSPIVILVAYYILFINISNLVIMCLCAFIYSISQQMHNCCIAKEKQEISYLFHTWLPNIAILASAPFKNIHLLYTSYILGYLISFALQALYIIRNDISLDKTTPISNEYKSRHSFFQQDLIGQVFSSLVIIISSPFLSSVEISKLTIYIKIGAVCNIIISLLNVSIYPIITRELRNNNNHIAINTLRKSSWISMILVLAYSLIIIIAWDLIKYSFKINSLSFLLIIPLLSSYSLVAFSSARQMLLNTFGYENIVKNYSWLVFIFGIPTLFVGAKTFSMTGTIIALSSILSLQAILNIINYRNLIR